MSSFIPNKHHLREVLIFCFNQKKTAAAAHRVLVEVYGEFAPSDTYCREWFRRFKCGDFRIEDKDRSGQPKKFKDKDLGTSLDQGSCQTQKELTKRLDINPQAISKRLKAGNSKKCVLQAKRQKKSIMDIPSKRPTKSDKLSPTQNNLMAAPILKTINGNTNLECEIKTENIQLKGKSNSNINENQYEAQNLEIKQERMDFDFVNCDENSFEVEDHKIVIKTEIEFSNSKLVNQTNNTEQEKDLETSDLVKIKNEFEEFSQNESESE